ncbi:apoptosis inhibitor 5-like isoform X2 [Sycon ciliatum]
MLQGVKGDAGARKLSAGFITKFFPSFPELSEKAIESLIDLCEDEDVSIRKLAIQHMPNVCREHGDNSSLSDILSQLLIAEDEGELRAVKRSLEALLKKDTCGTLAGLFFQINNNHDEACRDKSLRFLSQNVVALSPSLISGKEPVERYTLNAVKKAFPTVSSDEFPHFMKLLSCLSLVSTPEGAREVVDAIANVACLQEPFDASNADAVDRLLVCTRNALPSIRRGAAALQFTEYYVSNVALFAGVACDKSKVDLYQWLASLCCIPPSADDSLAIIGTLYYAIMTHLPALPSGGDSQASAAVSKASEQPVDYKVTECLLYSLHQLGKKCPDYFTEDEAAQSRLVLLRQRLQLVGVKAMSEQKSLRASLAGKPPAVIRGDSTLQSNQISLLACQSISTIIKAFFKNPPVYKDDLLPASINKENLVHQLTPITVQKRPAYSEDGLQAAKRSAPQTYQPPVGKYSNVSAPAAAAAPAAAKSNRKTAATTASTNNSGYALNEPSNPLMRGELAAAAASGVSGAVQRRGRGRGQLRGRGRGAAAAANTVASATTLHAQNFRNAPRQWRGTQGPGRQQQQQQQAAGLRRRPWKQATVAHKVSKAAPAAATGRKTGRGKLLRTSHVWQSIQDAIAPAREVAVIRSRSFPDVGRRSNSTGQSPVASPSSIREKRQLQQQQRQQRQQQQFQSIRASRGRGGGGGRGRGIAGRGRGNSKVVREISIASRQTSTGRQHKRWQRHSL